MRRKRSFRVGSSTFQYGDFRHPKAKERAEEKHWTSQNGPVRVYHVPPESLRDRSEDYAA